MSLVLNESLVLAKTRSQDLKSVLKLNCWGSGIKDVSLVRQLVNVEVIGLSCNEITTLEDFAYCTKLKELILRKNQIKNIAEVAYLQGLPKLTSLWLGENPCAENTHNYRKVVIKALPNLTVLDNVPVTREELQEIEELGNEIYEEIHYESSNSSGSGPPSAANNQNLAKHYGQQQQQQQQQQQMIGDYDTGNQEVAASHQEINYSNSEQFVNETSHFQSTNETHDTSSIITTAGGHHQSQMMNDSQLISNSMLHRTPLNVSRSSAMQLSQARSLSSQGSMTTLNGVQHQGWTQISNNNNNNNILPKGEMTGNQNGEDQITTNCEKNDYHQNDSSSQKTSTDVSDDTSSAGEGGNYWRLRYEKLLNDYAHLQKINQNLEDKLLNIVETFEKKREELVANIEYEKTTLMADVNKLSTKLVDARIKLHDYEEKELIHASECNSPCHSKNCHQVTKDKTNGKKDQTFMEYDPNLV